MVLVLVMMVVVYIGSLLGDKECGARWCGISSFPPEPPGRHINCLYLTATIPHVTSDHLKPLKKCCFLQLSQARTPPFLGLMPAPTPLEPDNQLWRFSPGFRPTIGCFSRRGKNAPLSAARPTRPRPTMLELAKLLLLRRRSSFNDHVFALFPSCLLPGNVGGRLVEVVS